MATPRDRVANWIRENGWRLAAAARDFARDQDEVEDILQDAYMVAIRRAHEIDPTLDPGPWLYRVVRNVGRARATKRGRRTRLMEMWGPQVGDEVVAPDVDTEQPDVDPVMMGVAELPELQRRVVMKRIVEDLSTRETAEELGCTEGTVKTSLFRALKRLREVLAQDESSGIDRTTERRGR